MASFDGSSDGGVDAGSSDPGPTDGGSPIGGTTTATTDVGSGNGGSDAGSSDASTATASDAGTPTAPAAIDYTVMVAIPAGINNGVSAADQATMLNAFGNPGTPDPGCGPSSPALQKLMKTASVGPFRCTGLGPAVDALTRVFAAVQAAEPALYAMLGTQGMLCVRFVRGSTTNFSNHSWGTAIDLTINGVLTPRGSTTVSQGLLSLCPYMLAEQFYWGAGFPTPDGMHYEVSNELITAWKANGTIP
jgi:D-alanyl-D-alanine dipeptidase